MILLCPQKDILTGTFRVWTDSFRWEGRERRCSADLNGLKIGADRVFTYHSFWKEN